MAKILPIRRKTHSRKKTRLPIEDRLSDVSFYIYGKVTLNAEHHSLKRVPGGFTFLIYVYIWIYCIQQFDMPF